VLHGARPHGAQDSSGWAGVQGRSPAETKRAAGGPIPERSVGPPRRRRVHSQEGAADKARGGIGRKPVSPAKQGRLAAKEETRQAAPALLASVNAPGTTRSDLRGGFALSLRGQTLSGLLNWPSGPAERSTPATQSRDTEIRFLRITSQVMDHP